MATHIDTLLNQVADHSRAQRVTSTHLRITNPTSSYTTSLDLTPGHYIRLPLRTSHGGSASARGNRPVPP